MKLLFSLLLALISLTSIAQTVNVPSLASGFYGDNPRSGAKYTTNPDLEVAFGNYSASTPLLNGGSLPPDASGVNWWNILVLHHENVGGTGDGWMSQEATAIGNGVTWKRWRAGNTGVWAPWVRQFDQVPDRTYTYTTTSWSTSAYTEVIPPGVLEEPKACLVKVVYNYPGQDYSVSIFTIVSSGNNGGSGTIADLQGNSAVYTVGGNRTVRLRLKKGSGTYGIEAALNAADMASSNATITVTTKYLF